MSQAGHVTALATWDADAKRLVFDISETRFAAMVHTLHPGAGERFVVRVEREAEIDREGWDCAKCGHRHAGLRFAHICIGCPCPETTPPDTAEDDWIRIASQNAKDATDRFHASHRARCQIHGCYYGLATQSDACVYCGEPRPSEICA